MDWQVIAICYMICSILLGEGLIYTHKKKGERCPPGEYFIIIFLWPLCIFVLIIMNIRKR